MTHVEAAAKNKTRIQLPVDAMKRVKSVSGGVSFHCGDDVAEKLNGLPLDHVKSVASTLGIDTGKYDHLNPGQQRMNIGNLIRAHVRKNPDSNPVFADAAHGVREAHEKATAEQRAQAEADAETKRAAKEAADAEKVQKAEDRKAAKEAKDAEKAQKAADRQAAKEAKEADAAAKKQAAADKKEAAQKAREEKAAAKLAEKAEKAAAKAAPKAE